MQGFKFINVLNNVFGIFLNKETIKQSFILQTVCYKVSGKISSGLKVTWCSNAKISSITHPDTWFFIIFLFFPACLYSIFSMDTAHTWALQFLLNKN